MKKTLMTIVVSFLLVSVVFSQPDTITILHINDSHSTLGQLVLVITITTELWAEFPGLQP